MADSIRIGTFNAENLIARYIFKNNERPLKEGGFSVNERAFELLNDDAKRLTQEAIRKTNADILCLQEIEGLTVLDKMVSEINKKIRSAADRYRHTLLIDSHEQRRMDVAIISRYPFAAVRTNKDTKTKNNRSYLFSRDCLEADFLIGGRPLTLYVNHFKSMMEGREKSRPRRFMQAKAVAKIIDDAWGVKNYEDNFVVLGDMNDYPGEGTALNPLLGHNHLKNVVSRLPEENQWTHYWSGGNEYRQLDYLLLSGKLGDENTGPPEIMRMGMPLRATRYEGVRFDGVGQDNPKSSDHCPVYMDIRL